MSISLGTPKSAKTPPAVGKMIRPFHKKFSFKTDFISLHKLCSTIAERCPHQSWSMYCVALIPTRLPPYYFNELNVASKKACNLLQFSDKKNPNFLIALEKKTFLHIQVYGQKLLFLNFLVRQIIFINYVGFQGQQDHENAQG